MDDEVTLKEILMGVSRKLDEFLVAHAQLHTEMALQAQRMESLMASHTEWSSDRAAELKELRDEVEMLSDWKISVESQLRLMKWLAGGGAVSAAAFVARLLGVPLP